MRKLITGAGGLLTASLLSGCAFGQGLYNVPLPGGADVGRHPYHVTVQLTDALDLVPQAGVKVNDVAVGKVTEVRLEPSGKVADVVVEVNRATVLPANAIASVQQTSLLGEKYIALAPPLGTAATGRLADGATIGVDRTSDGVEIEQVLGALSLLLNGGGIAQLHDITVELNQFAGGHEPAIRTFLTSTTKVVSQLNANKQSIVDTLEALDTLGGTLRQQNTQIARILTSFAPGVKVLADERDQLISALNSLNSLSAVSVQTLNASKDNTIADLKALAPILQQLASAGSAFPRSLQVLATFPFSDGALQGILGDYLNAFVTPEYRTPGGVIVTTDGPGSGAGPHDLPNGYPPPPSSSTAAPGAVAAAVPASSTPPSGLLPTTSSAAPGLPATLPLLPSSSASSTSSSSSSASASSAPTSSPAASDSASGSPSAPVSSSAGSPTSSSGGQ